MSNLFSFPSRRESAVDFDALVRPHVKYLYRLAYRFCGNKDDAEDLVQDLLVKLYPRRVELAEVEKLRPWLTTSLYRMFIDGTRRRARSPINLVDDENSFYDTVEGNEEGPAESLQREQQLDRLQQAFERLNEDHRILITLHDIEGYRLTELQTMLDVPVGTLKSRIHRARARMRELLSV
jgi:RNA polymerase sigma-70 factor (ECF subfamily)